MKDLFGDDVLDTIPEKKITGKYQIYRKRYNYRLSENKITCANCIHSVTYINNDKRYLKCKLQGIASSTNSDIRHKYICDNHKV